ncbi:MAG TPA: amidase family protein, partial [Bryobacteraceae bacterium]|nr:amidase family protein [Bryobacteraceae bacterium]
MSRRWSEILESRRQLLQSAAAGTGLIALGGMLRAAQERALAANGLALLSIEEAASLVRKKAVSPVELTRACLDRIGKLNPALNAFITVTAETAKKQARQAEAEVQRGNWRGPLHGIPIAL